MVGGESEREMEAGAIHISCICALKTARQSGLKNFPNHDNQNAKTAVRCDNDSNQNIFEV